MSYQERSVISADGTVIFYRRYGDGPALILIHGNLQAAQSFDQLAEALSVTFTVCVPDRRGRGLSGPHGAHHSVDRESEDIAALVAATGARYLFGLSAGAVIALDAARHLQVIEKVALYEPPFSPVPVDWLPRYEDEIAGGRLASAFLTLLKGLKTGGPFSWLPRFLTLPVLTLMFRAQGSGSAGKVPLSALLPLTSYDVRMVVAAQAGMDGYAGLSADTLLMLGGDSPAFFAQAADRLNSVLPQAEHVTLPGLDHIGPDDAGNPGRVAEILLIFFQARSGGRERFCGGR